MEITAVQTNRRGLLDQLFQTRSRLFELSAALEGTEAEQQGAGSKLSGLSLSVQPLDACARLCYHGFAFPQGATAARLTVRARRLWNRELRSAEALTP